MHHLRKKELIKLVREFIQQHEDGVCKIKTFRQLVKMSYPTATTEDVDAMVEFIDSMKTFEAAAIQAADERRREVEAVFMAIDTDSGGTIELDEFLQVKDSTTYSVEALTRLFYAKDADGSGSLDMQEFVNLIVAFAGS